MLPKLNPPEIAAEVLTPETPGASRGEVEEPELLLLTLPTPDTPAASRTTVVVEAPESRAAGK